MDKELHIAPKQTEKMKAVVGLTHEIKNHKNCKPSHMISERIYNKQESDKNSSVTQ